MGGGGAIMLPTLAGGDLMTLLQGAFTSSTAMTASTHLTAISGVVPRSGTITSIGFRLGAITKGATTTLSVSLQDTSLTAGPPTRPDGTADQSGTLANVDIVANTWVTVTLGTSRTVTVGELLSVVIGFGTFNASDSIAISHHGAAPLQHNNTVATYNGTTWTAASAATNVILGYSSGNNGTFPGSGVASSITSSAFNSSSTPDERGARWIPAVSTRVTGLAAAVDPGAEFDLVLYDLGGTALGTISFDRNAQRSASQRVAFGFFSSPVDIVAGTTYYVAIKPTTTTNITFITYNVPNAIDRDAWPMGTDFTGATRTDAGAWTLTDTAVPALLPYLDPQPASGGGGMIIHPGMSGGMRG